jgi:hypothetical protein
MEGASTLISTEDGKDRGRVHAGGDVETAAATDDNAYLRKISEGRKDLLLAVFSLGMFMDSESNFWVAECGLKALSLRVFRVLHHGRSPRR